MNLKFQQFKQLHAANKLFVLANAWDAKSAMVLQQQSFPAIATSSAAVAESLGYNDGEEMSFEEYFFVVKRILAVINVPLTVDIETGYGKTSEEIYDNVKKLATAGVVGINIEDSVITKEGRSLQEAATFAAIIQFIKQQLTKDGLHFFINLRCDTYILNVDNKQEATAQRLKVYEDCGADGIFLPCISEEADIAAAVKQTKLPVNVMCIPGLSGFDKLNQLGVKRVSVGPFLFKKVYQQIEVLSKAINADENFVSLFS